MVCVIPLGRRKPPHDFMDRRRCRSSLRLYFRRLLFLVGYRRQHPIRNGDIFQTNNNTAMVEQFQRGVFCLLRCLAAAFAFAAAASGASAQSVGTFEFSDWSGPPLSIHFVEPAGLDASAPIVIVMHGVRRNADEYRDNWINLAQEHGLAIYAPEFDVDRFPRSLHYNLGSVGTDRPSAFSAIEPLFDAIKHRRNAPQDNYVIFGHSAGSQFVHRFAMLANNTRFSLAIAANAGWYTMPSVEKAWPYGLGGEGPGSVDLEAAFARPLVIMLGDEDNDPNAPNLRNTRDARAQGRHRYARGGAFLKTASDVANEMNVPLNWRYKIVEGVGHDNAGMAQAAAPFIAANAAQQSGTK